MKKTIVFHDNVNDWFSFEKYKYDHGHYPGCKDLEDVEIRYKTPGIAKLGGVLLLAGLFYASHLIYQGLKENYNASKPGSNLELKVDEGEK